MRNNIKFIFITESQILYTGKILVVKNFMNFCEIL